MASLSAAPIPESFRNSGVAPEQVRNAIRKRLENVKREAVESAMGKGESWVTKLLSGDSGVKLDDLPALLSALGLKVVSVEKMCVDPELAKSYESIVRAATAGRSLLFEDAE